MSLFNSICRFLSSYRCSAVLGIIFIVAIAAATFIERSFGISSAKEIVYTSWWFMAINGLFVLNFILLSRRLRLRESRKRGVLLLHYGFTIMLAGALVTHLFCEERQVLVMEGEISSSTLPFTIYLEDFSNEDGYRSEIIINRGEENEKQCVVEMNKIARWGIYRIYQSSYTPDCKGSIFIVNNDLPGTTITYIGYLSLFVGLFTALLNRKSHFRNNLSQLKRENLSKWRDIVLALSTLLSAVTVFFALRGVIGSSMDNLQPVLRSNFLFIHVGIVTFGYGFLAISAIFSILILLNIQPHKYSIAAELTISIGLLFLTIGIFTGGIWANLSWGRYWGWDPKESWALVSMMAYTLTLHTKRVYKRESSKRFALFSLLSLSAVVMTFIGVGKLFGGMHSY